MNVVENEIIELTPPTNGSNCLWGAVNTTTVNKLRSLLPAMTPTCEWGTGRHKCPASATVKHENIGKRYLCSVHAFETQWGDITSHDYESGITMIEASNEIPDGRDEYDTDWVQCPKGDKIHPAVDTVGIIIDLHKNHGYSVEQSIDIIESEFDVSFVY